MEKYNRDYLRHYIIKNSKGADIVFDWEAFKDIHRFYNIFLNACNYMNLYLEIDLSKKAASKKGLETEDKWLLSRLNSLQEKALESYNKYVFFDAIAAIEQFILEDLSRTYIKLVRERVGTKSQKAVEETLSICLSSLLRMLAPIAPHISEYIYQDMKSKKMPESVHLLELPGLDKKAIDKELEKQFETARRLSEAALALREGQKMKLRWPLKELVVQSKKGKELKKVLGVLAKTVNVKKCTEAKKKPKGKFALKEAEGGFKLFLNVEADAALKDEWELMELRRRIQEARKQAKLNPNQKAKLLLGCSDAAFAKKFKAQLEKDTNTKIQLL
jgi:isoleucyl-tRNA synthetase